MKRPSEQPQQMLLHVLAFGMMAGALALTCPGCGGNRAVSSTEALPVTPAASAPAGSSYSAEAQAQEQNGQEQAQMMAQSDSHRTGIQQRKGQ